MGPWHRRRLILVFCPLTRPRYLLGRVTSEAMLECLLADTMTVILVPDCLHLHLHLILWVRCQLIVIGPVFTQVCGAARGLLRQALGRLARERPKALCSWPKSEHNLTTVWHAEIFRLRHSCDRRPTQRERLKRCCRHSINNRLKMPVLAPVGATCTSLTRFSGYRRHGGESCQKPKAPYAGASAGAPGGASDRYNAEPDGCRRDPGMA